MSWSRPRVAAALWLVFALVVWNVIFDRVLVLAGRRYVFAAAVAANTPGGSVLIREWMPQAAARGARLASAAAAAIIFIGLGGIFIATRGNAGVNASRKSGG